MKRKNILLSTTAIAASLVMSSVAAQQSKESALGWPWQIVKNSDAASDFFDGIDANNGRIVVSQPSKIKIIANALNLTEDSYDIEPAGSGSIMTINSLNYGELTLSEYLATTVGEMSNNKLATIYRSLQSAKVKIWFNDKSNAESFIQDASSIVDLSCMPHDGGCYMANGSEENETTLY